MSNSSSQSLLTNVIIIRISLIVMLVFYHAFAIYSGAWNAIEGFPTITVYFWLDKFCYAFMLEMFVFISGYVFGFQVRTKGEVKLVAKNLFPSKFKRLMIPCIFFSIIYIFLFNEFPHSLFNFFYDLFNGVGHLWFLPMLFWCFVWVWIIEKIHISPCLAFSIFLIIAILPMVSLPLRISTSSKYIVFFYIGYILQRLNLKIDKYLSFRNVCCFIFIFLVIFPSYTILQKYFDYYFGDGTNQLIIKILIVSVKNFIKLVYSSLGVYVFFSLVGILLSNRSKDIPHINIKLGNLCMGVYIFQQFILKGIYSYTCLPNTFGPYLLPWFSFFITLILSLITSHFLHQTKFGRILIG